MAKSLTPKQQALVAAYVDTGSQVEAYREAYDAKDSSLRTAYVNACHILAKPHVNEALQNLYIERAKANLITKERVLLEYGRIAFGTLPGIVDYENGLMTIEAFSNLTDAQRAIIKEFEYRQFDKKNEDGHIIETITLVKVKLCDKMAALKEIASYLRMTDPRFSMLANIHGGLAIYLNPTDVQRAERDEQVKQAQLEHEAQAAGRNGRGNNK
jgi:phage terminase small subunit